MSRRNWFFFPIKNTFTPERQQLRPENYHEEQFVKIDPVKPKLQKSALIPE
jgi:hypothetical protein